MSHEGTVVEITKVHIIKIGIQVSFFIFLVRVSGAPRFGGLKLSYGWQSLNDLNKFVPVAFNPSPVVTVCTVLVHSGFVARNRVSFFNCEFDKFFCAFHDVRFLTALLSLLIQIYTPF